MWVTAYTDASFRDGRGFWAVWIKSERGRVTQSGECPDWVDTNTAAEMWAAWMGLYIAHTEWPNTQGVLVCSDCMSTIRFMWPWSKKPNRESMRRIQEDIIKYQVEHKIRVRTKHVKGHRRDDSVQTYVNNRVDAMAGGAGKCKTAQ